MQITMKVCSFITWMQQLLTKLAHTTAVVAALTMACATSAVRQASYNDILAIAKKNTVHSKSFLNVEEID